MIWTLEVQKEEPNVSFKRKTEQLSGRLYLKRKIVKLRYKMASVFVPGKRKRYSQVQLLPKSCFRYYIPQSDTYKMYLFIWGIGAKISILA